jgi:hypothetical protein
MSVRPPQGSSTPSPVSDGSISHEPPKNLSVTTRTGTSPTPREAADKLIKKADELESAKLGYVRSSLAKRGYFQQAVKNESIAKAQYREALSGFMKAIGVDSTKLLSRLVQNKIISKKTINEIVKIDAIQTRIEVIETSLKDRTSPLNEMQKYDLTNMLKNVKEKLRANEDKAAVKELETTERTMTQAVLLTHTIQTRIEVIETSLKDKTCPLNEQQKNYITKMLQNVKEELRVNEDKAAVKELETTERTMTQAVLLAATKDLRAKVLGISKEKLSSADKERLDNLKYSLNVSLTSDILTKKYITKTDLNDFGYLYKTRVAQYEELFKIANQQQAPSAVSQAQAKATAGDSQMVQGRPADIAKQAQQEEHFRKQLIQMQSSLSVQLKKLEKTKTGVPDIDQYQSKAREDLMKGSAFLAEQPPKIKEAKQAFSSARTFLNSFLALSATPNATNVNLLKGAYNNLIKAVEKSLEIVASRLRNAKDDKLTDKQAKLTALLSEIAQKKDEAFGEKRKKIETQGQLDKIREEYDKLNALHEKYIYSP